MSDKTKHEWFHKGWYVIPVPPVPTTYWTSKDWIRYIDSNKGWARPIKEKS